MIVQYVWKGEKAINLIPAYNENLSNQRPSQHAYA